MKCFRAFLICVLSLTSNAMAQSDQKTITLFSEIPKSPSLSEYVRVLTEKLETAGFNATPLVESGDIRKTLSDHDTGSALGMAYLQTQTGEGDMAAALFSTPGEFESFNEQRAALQGVIGDAARSEINDEDVVALRLWPHSTGIFVSTTRFDSVDDFQGKNIHTDDPYSVALFENLGAEIKPLAPTGGTDFSAAGAKQYGGNIQEWLSMDADNVNAMFLPKGDLDDQIVIPNHKLWAGVTMASFDWWLSLTAREQRQLIGALEAAEEAAAEIVENDTNKTIKKLQELGITTVSWREFNKLKFQNAMLSSISDKTGVDTKAVMQLYNYIDYIKGIRQRPPHQDTETNEPEQKCSEPEQKGSEPEQKGSLNTPARVFFATNRRFDQKKLVDKFANSQDPEKEKERLVDKFANSQDPENVLRCGELAPPGLGEVGEVSGEVTLVKGSMIVQGEDACVEEISSAVYETGGKALIHVHGYANEFKAAVRTGLAFSRDAEREGVVVVWSWPSGGCLRHYGLDTERIKTSEPIFDSFSRSLSESRGVRTVNFLAHSMGSRLLANLMRDNWIEQPSAVVLAAADVSRFFLKQAVKAAQSASITLYATKRDFALLASGVFHQDPRAGRADPLLLIDGMDTIDMTAFDKWLGCNKWEWLGCNNHRHVFVEPEIVADLAELFRGNWTAAERGLKPHRISGLNVDYYKIFPDGR